MHEKLTILFICLATCFTSLFAQLAKCDECLFDRISLFDATINVPRPTGDTMPYQYEKLSSPMQFANSYIFNNDPTRHCFRFYRQGYIDGQISTGHQPVPKAATTPLSKIIGNELANW